MELDDKKKQAYRVGAAVFILLVFLSIGEFFLGYISSLWWSPILAIAIIKAFFIIREYMHIGRLFTADEVSE